MEQNNGLEVKISKEEIRITIMIDLQEILPHLIRIFLQGQTSIWEKAPEQWKII